MRAAKLPVAAISGTASAVDSAGRIMKGLAAAGQAVVEEAVKVAGSSGDPRPPTSPAPPPGGNAPPAEKP